MPTCRVAASPDPPDAHLFVAIRNFMYSGTTGAANILNLEAGYGGLGAENEVYTLKIAIFKEDTHRFWAPYFQTKHDKNHLQISGIIFRDAWFHVKFDRSKVYLTLYR